MSFPLSLVGSLSYWTSVSEPRTVYLSPKQPLYNY